MLVCNISQRPLRRALAADLQEIANAADLPDWSAIYASLVDDPTNTNDIVDAFIGEIMGEAAAAADAVDATSTYTVGILENITAVDFPDGGRGPSTYGVALAEAANATDAADFVIPITTTWDTVGFATGFAYSNGNLTATCTANGHGTQAQRGHNSGKYYCEFTMNTWNDLYTGCGIGSGPPGSGAGFPGSGSLSVGVLNNGQIWLNQSYTGTQLTGQGTGCVIGVAIDIGAALIWWRVSPSGNWNNSGTANPATGTGGINISSIIGNMFPMFYVRIAGDVCTANFGATAFSGTPPAGFTLGWP